MFKYGHFLSWGTPGFILALLIFAMFSAGCSLISSPGASEAPATPPLTANAHERSSGSLMVDVVDFTWGYRNEGAHLVISGEVINNSNKPQQALTLYAQVYDEAGGFVGSGQSYLVPTYLPIGAKGTFEFTLMPMRTEGIQFLKLVTTARML